MGKADSMAILAVIVSIAIFGLFNIFLTEPINAIIDAVNANVANGQLSEMTLNYFNQVIKMWKMTPFFMIIGLVVYVVERMKTDIPIQTYIEYLFGMIFGVILSGIFVYLFGSVFDAILYQTASLRNVPAAWDSSSFINFIVRMIYYISLLPAYIGSILYMFFPIIQELGLTSIFQSSEPEEENYENNYSLEQF